MGFMSDAGEEYARETVEKWHPRCARKDGTAWCEHFRPLDISDEIPVWGIGHCALLSDELNGGPYFSTDGTFYCRHHTEVDSDYQERNG